MNNSSTIGNGSSYILTVIGVAVYLLTLATWY